MTKKKRNEFQNLEGISCLQLLSVGFHFCLSFACASTMSCVGSTILSNTILGNIIDRSKWLSAFPCACAFGRWGAVQFCG